MVHPRAVRCRRGIGRRVGRVHPVADAAPVVVALPRPIAQVAKFPGSALVRSVRGRRRRQARPDTDCHRRRFPGSARTGCGHGGTDVWVRSFENCVWNVGPEPVWSEQGTAAVGATGRKGRALEQGAKRARREELRDDLDGCTSCRRTPGKAIDAIRYREWERETIAHPVTEGLNRLLSPAPPPASHAG